MVVSCRGGVGLWATVEGAGVTEMTGWGRGCPSGGLPPAGAAQPSCLGGRGLPAMHACVHPSVRGGPPSCPAAAAPLPPPPLKKLLLAPAACCATLCPLALLQKVTLETALSGGAPRVSQIRQQQQVQQESTLLGGAPAAGSGGFGQRYNAPQQYGSGGGGGGSFGGR